MKVLFLTHRLPYAPNRGDRIRSYHLLRHMSAFADVSVFSLVHDDEEAAHLGALPFARRVAGTRVSRISSFLHAALILPTRQPVTHAMLWSPNAASDLARLAAETQPDVVLAFCSGMARFVTDSPLVNLPFVLDMVDVDSLKWSELSSKSPAPLSWIYRREAKTLGAFEARAAALADCTLLVNAREHEALRAIAPSANLRIVPIGIDVKMWAPGDAPADSPVVVFCGVMNYQPNVDGVTWFAKSVWPLVRQSRSDARFVVVGSDPSRAVRALADEDRSIEVVGRVDQVQPYLWGAAVSVAPLHTARGLQNKALEALAAGLPVVLTPAVLAGLPAGVRSACSVSDTAEEFAARVVELLGMTPAQRRALAQGASIDKLDWKEQLQPLKDILEDAIGRRQSRKV